MRTASDEEQRIHEIHFAEDWGMMFELLSQPRMAGRVWATIAMAEEPHLAAGDLEDRLETSAGSVSSAVHFLLRQGVIERVRVPGERRLYFTLRPNSSQALLARLVALITELRELAERGVAEFGGRELARGRFAEAADFYRALEKEIPALTETRGAKKERRVKEGGR